VGDASALRVGAAFAVLLCTLALAACGDDEGPSTTTANPTSPPGVDPDPPELEPVPAPDGEEPGTPPEEAPPGERDHPLSVEEVVAAVLTRSGSPQEGCEELVTERFVEHAYGDRAGCLAARRSGGLASTLKDTHVDASGDSATARVIPEGGPYDGIEVDVELVRDPGRGGAWLVDSLAADVPAGP